MGDAPTTGVPTAIIAHRRPVAQVWVPPPVVLCYRPGESSYTDARLGLLIYRYVGLCLLTGAGPWFPSRFHPWQ
jgi:hypothetical protein